MEMHVYALQWGAGKHVWIFINMYRPSVSCAPQCTVSPYAPLYNQTMYQPMYVQPNMYPMPMSQSVQAPSMPAPSMPPSNVPPQLPPMLPAAAAIPHRLLQLTVRTGYEVVQENGQRHYGPPPGWHGPPPRRGCEVFLGRLPTDCFEDELVPILETVGVVYELRLMMNFTGFTRGFAFVTYTTRYDAWMAVEILNHLEIRPGHKIGATKSVDNCRLYIGGIPVEKTKDDAWDELCQQVQGIVDVILYHSKDDHTKNRGFMFVEFESHRLAAMAKRKMMPGNTVLWNQKVVVDWADPEPDVNPNILSTVTKLFVRNSHLNFNEVTMRAILLKVLPPNCVTRVYIACGYGFLHFDTRKNAELAKEKLTGIQIDGQPLEVQWARPKVFRKNGSSPSITFCRSVPPRMRQQNRVKNGKNKD